MLLHLISNWHAPSVSQQREVLRLNFMYLTIFLIFQIRLSGQRHMFLWCDKLITQIYFCFTQTLTPVHQQLTELTQNQLSHRTAVVNMSRFIVTFILFRTFSDPVGSMLVLVPCWWDDVVHWALTQNYMRFDFNDNKLTSIMCESHDTVQTGSVLYFLSSHLPVY